MCKLFSWSIHLLLVVKIQKSKIQITQSQKWDFDSASFVQTFCNKTT